MTIDTDAFEQAEELRDELAVRALAQRVDALVDGEERRALASASRALRAALGRLRADALAALLARDERDEFIRRAADPEYAETVALDELKLPRFLALASYACACGARLSLPYDRQGGPARSFCCPSCDAPYLARPVYEGAHDYALRVEVDERALRKRSKRSAR